VRDDDTLEVVAVPTPGADIALELYAAGQRTDLLAEALGRRVRVVDAAAAAAAEVPSAGV
jgi:hypothetical protein